MNAVKLKQIGGAMAFIASLCVLMTGCSSAPSSGDGERAIQDRIKQEAEGRINLTKFLKDNGAQGELMGFKIYKLEFTAEVEFTENCKWVTGFMGSQLSFRTTKPPAENQNGLAAFMEASQNPGEVMRKGQRVQMSGVINFVKKEKGWAVDGVEVSRATTLKSGKPDPAADAEFHRKLLEITSGPTAAAPVQIDQGRPSIATDLEGTARQTESKNEIAVDHAGAQKRAASIVCINNLKQINLAFKQWALDHGDMFPFQISTNGGKTLVGNYVKGGTLEFCSRGSDGFDGSAPIIFQVMSNELETTKILVCPADAKKTAAPDFKHVSAQNVSYQVRTDEKVVDTNPDEIICRCPIHGHVALMDGSVKRGNLIQ